MEKKNFKQVPFFIWNSLYKRILPLISCKRQTDFYDVVIQIFYLESAKKKKKKLHESSSRGWGEEKKKKAPQPWDDNNLARVTNGDVPTGGPLF